MRRRVVAMAGAGLALAGTGVWLATRVPADSPAPASTPPPPPAPCPTLERPPPTISPKVWDEAVGLFADYLVDDSPTRTTARTDLLKALARWERQGVDFLADPDLLASVLYASRPFDLAYSPDRRGAAEVSRDDVDGVTTVVPKDGTAFSFSLPASYPAEVERLWDLNPYPAIVTLHDPADADGPRSARPFAGERAIRRRFSKAGPLRAASEEWLLLAPAPSPPAFATDPNRHVFAPLTQVWKRYHVDFDRVVLDGGDDALAIAVSTPVFFSGLILRGDAASLDPRLAVNAAHLPIYLLGAEDGPAARRLRAAGLSPTAGDEAGLARWLGWMCGRPRQTPVSFRWFAEAPAKQGLAHWINLNQADPGAELTVAADRSRNEVRIDARGVREVGVFLNDRIVDLSRPMTLFLNGKEAFPPKAHARTLDRAFEHPRARIRASGYYGWLYPVSFDRVAVPEPR